MQLTSNYSTTIISDVLSQKTLLLSHFPNNELLVFKKKVTIVIIFKDEERYVTYLPLKQI